MAVAIALGESGGDTNAHNPNSATGDNSYGLWQINMLGRLQAERLELFGISSNEELFNPAINAKAAYILYKNRGNFGDWSVYNHGTWLRYRSEAMNAKPEGELPDTGEGDDGGNWWDVFFEINPWWNPSDEPIDVRDPLDDIGNALGQITNIFQFISDPENWKRVALFIGGAAALGIGLYMLIDQNTNLNPTKYIPAARAVKKVTGG